MHKYAQIDLSTGRCFSVSYLSGPVDAPYMIPLSPEEDVLPGDVWDGQKWTRPDPPAPDPTVDPITQLQLAVAELAEAQEQAITDMQLALAELAEIISGGDN
jgi:hypothetical protein